MSLRDPGARDAAADVGPRLEHVVSRIDSVPAKLVCSGLKPTLWAGNTSRLDAGGQPLERRTHDARR